MSDNIGKASLVQLRKLCVIFVCQIIFLLIIEISYEKMYVSYNTVIYHFVQNDQYLYLIYNKNQRLCTYFL